MTEEDEEESHSKKYNNTKQLEDKYFKQDKIQYSIN